jgi:hypothetical protein
MKAWVLAAAALVLSGPGAPVVHAAPPPAAATPGAATDNLRLVSSTRSRRVYVAPGADLSHVNRIILEPTEVAFADNWVRDFNRTRRSGRLTDRDAERIRNEVSTGMGDVFSRAFQNAGYQIVGAPGPDVVRVLTKVANLSVTAPDVRASARSRTYSRTAGQATLILEVRDSQTSAVLGRTLDGRIAGDTRTSLRNAVTNRADFRRMFQAWASAAIDDLAALKTASRPGSRPGR